MESKQKKTVEWNDERFKKVKKYYPIKEEILVKSKENGPKRLKYIYQDILFDIFVWEEDLQSVLL